MHLVDAPADVRAELAAALKNCKVAQDSQSPIDFIHLFTKSKAALAGQFKALTKRLAPAGMLWVSWPKKSSGVETDLNENIVREIGLASGLVDVKVCAVTEVWSGLKFVRRLKDR